MRARVAAGFDSRHAVFVERVRDDVNAVVVPADICQRARRHAEVVRVDPANPATLRERLVDNLLREVSRHIVTHIRGIVLRLACRLEETRASRQSRSGHTWRNGGRSTKTAPDLRRARSRTTYKHRPRSSE